ncbi:MAG TPA: class I SAM-dependent methyltransferase [Thermomicrobiales bacterium]|nr:class I SAM-dependent methyltransferase [Thermomicrobiales bacterium]
MANDDHREASAGFESIYAEAARGARGIPWDLHAPNPLLIGWFDRAAPQPHSDGRRAIVVGAGTGDDAAFVARQGYATTAFDIAPSAVEAARERHPDSTAEFVVADLLTLPGEWRGGFDLVVEIRTVQSLPRSLREDAIREVVRLVAPGGTVVVIAAASDSPRIEGPPWPLTRAELDGFERAGLAPVAVDCVFRDGIGPFASHWLAEYTRAASD